jgi:hypothetical protein
MNRDDIIRMAKNEFGIYAFTADDLAKFAELVAAKDTELLQQLLWLCSKDGGWSLEEAANTICEIENILRARLG